MSTVVRLLLPDGMRRSVQIETAATVRDLLDTVATLIRVPEGLNSLFLERELADGERVYLAMGEKVTKCLLTPDAMLYVGCHGLARPDHILAEEFQSFSHSVEKRLRDNAVSFTIIQGIIDLLVNHDMAGALRFAKYPMDKSYQQSSAIVIKHPHSTSIEDTYSTKAMVNYSDQAPPDSSALVAALPNTSLKAAAVAGTNATGATDVVQAPAINKPSKAQTKRHSSGVSNVDVSVVAPIVELTASDERGPFFSGHLVIAAPAVSATSSSDFLNRDHPLKTDKASKSAPTKGSTKVITSKVAVKGTGKRGRGSEDHGSEPPSKKTAVETTIAPASNAMTEKESQDSISAVVAKPSVDLSKIKSRSKPAVSKAAPPTKPSEASKKTVEFNVKDVASRDPTIAMESVSKAVVGTTLSMSNGVNHIDEDSDDVDSDDDDEGSPAMRTTARLIVIAETLADMDKGKCERGSENQGGETQTKKAELETAIVPASNAMIEKESHDGLPAVVTIPSVDLSKVKSRSKPAVGKAAPPTKLSAVSKKIEEEDDRDDDDSSDEDSDKEDGAVKAAASHMAVIKDSAKPQAAGVGKAAPPTKLSAVSKKTEEEDDSDDDDSSDEDSDKEDGAVKAAASHMAVIKESAKPQAAGVGKAAIPTKPPVSSKKTEEEDDSDDDDSSDIDDNKSSDDDSENDLDDMSEPVIKAQSTPSGLKVLLSRHYNYPLHTVLMHNYIEFAV
jgi:hypothetical protein